MKLVVAPLEGERVLLSRCLTARGYGVTRGHVGRLPVMCATGLGMSLVCCGHGKAQAAAQTQYLLDQDASFDSVVCAGCAGGLGGGAEVGDIVVGVRTVEHDFVQRFVSEPAPVFLGCGRAIDELQRLQLPEARFKVHFGTIASGDQDIVDSEAAGSVLRVCAEAMAVAWEGAGVARSCRFSRRSFVELRGITDVPGDAAAQDFGARLQQAMDNLAVLLIAWGRAKEVA
jgi:adenosylhomocysteine nucleosidase